MNLNEYQPRADRKTHSWFRIDNTIIFSEKLDNLTAAQRWFWIALLSYASFKNRNVKELTDIKSVFPFDVAYFEKHFGVTKKEMTQALIELEVKGTVKLERFDALIDAVESEVVSGSAERCQAVSGGSPTYIHTYSARARLSLILNSIA